MSSAISQFARNLLEAPLVREKPVEHLGNALWLYVRLLTAASYRGTVCRHIDKLAIDLSVTSERIEHWLKRLADAGLIEIECPAPFLVIKLGMWSNNVPSQGEESNPSHSSSYSYLQSKQEAIAQEDRGVGEGEGELLKEILTTLGETDPSSFHKVLEHYTPIAIRQALDRVRSVPDDRVRKNRTALFRFLLTKSP